MNGGSNRRFPRTARVAPESQPTIEREKIRHRHPKDLLFDDPPPAPSRAPQTDDPADHRLAHDVYVDEGVIYDDDASDWADGNGDAPEVSAWDDESEDDWVLHGEDGASSHSDAFDEDVGQEDGYVEIYDDEEEGGVVWEDDVVADPYPSGHPDEIALGQQQQTFGFAPEVELAGRRDVRPKPPRPAPPPRAAAPRRQARQQRPAHDPRGRQRDERRMPPSQPDMAELPPRRDALDTRRPSAEPDFADDTTMPPASPGRFSRTRATLDDAAGRLPGGSDEQVLHQPRQGSQPRRRQAPATPPLTNMPKRDRYGAIRPRGAGPGG